MARRHEIAWCGWMYSPHLQFHPIVQVATVDATAPIKDAAFITHTNVLIYAIVTTCANKLPLYAREEERIAIKISGSD